MKIDDYINKTLETWKMIDLTQLSQAVEFLRSAIKSKQRIFVCGNGGSSSTASHFVNDWVKTISTNSYLPHGHIICLSDNISLLTAIANDISYDEVFAYQLRAIGSARDVLVAISGSGNSKNVIAACKLAREIGMTVVALTGYDGGEVRRIADFGFHCPVEDMQIVEDLHMSFGHMVVRCS